MKSGLKKKWLAVGVTWGVVLAMTGWNIHLISQVQTRRQDLETLQMDLNFIDVNQTEIQEVHRKKSRLAHPVASFGLGFMVVENDLKRLSWDFGLKQMEVSTENNFQNTRAVPITIITTGPIPAIVGWIAAVEEAYPYLVIALMDISYDRGLREGRLQATFNYHYTLSDPERTG